MQHDRTGRRLHKVSGDVRFGDRSQHGRVADVREHFGGVGAERAREDGCRVEWERGRFHRSKDFNASTRVHEKEEGREKDRL